MMPKNCIEVNGYWICQDEQLFHLYDPAQGGCWFGFDFTDLESAKRACDALSGNK